LRFICHLPSVHVLGQVQLLLACKQRNIPVLCVAGAGAKADPTRLRFVDLSESSIDPLARSVRHK
jgi:tRNA A37 threonylcarbamoyladenosine dehydratase